jgi:hypothetical protein
MIKPIYFPSTYLPPETAAAMRSVCTAMVGYHPGGGGLTDDMHALVESGFLEIVTPAGDAAPGLDRTIQEFERWGRRHRGGAGLLSSFLSDRPGLDPLMADGTAAQIAAAIQRRPEAAAAPATAALMRSLVFLQLAHQADHLGHQARADLRRYERAQADLFSTITGKRPTRTEAFIAELPAAEPDPMLERRLNAWARLFLLRPYASPIFAAARPEVIEILAERFPALRRVGRSVLSRMVCEQATPAASLSGDGLSRLALLASRPLPEPDGCAEGGDLDPAIYVLPDISPSHLFACLAEPGNAVETSADPHWRHTLILRISPQRVPAGHPAAVDGRHNSE